MCVSFPFQVVEFQMDSVYLQSSSSCTKDGVSLYDTAVDAEAQLLVIYCGTTTGSPFLTTAQGALVRFYTDSSGSSLGFKSHYLLVSESSCKSCGCFLLKLSQY